MWLSFHHFHLLYVWRIIAFPVSISNGLFVSTSNENDASPSIGAAGDVNQEYDKDTVKSIMLRSCVVGCQVLMPKCWKACHGNYTSGKYLSVPDKRNKPQEIHAVKVDTVGMMHFQELNIDDIQHTKWQRLIADQELGTNDNWTCYFLDISEDCSQTHPSSEGSKFTSKNHTYFLVNSVPYEKMISDGHLSSYLPLQSDDPFGSSKIILVNSTVEDVNGTLIVCIYWRHKILDNNFGGFLIDYARNSCRVNTSFPGCNKPNMFWTDTIKYLNEDSGAGLQVHCLQQQDVITYNSKFQIWIQYTLKPVGVGVGVGVNRTQTTRSKDIVVRTPGCLYHDHDFTYCHKSCPEHSYQCVKALPYFVKLLVSSSCLGIHSDGSMKLHIAIEPPSVNYTSISYTLVIVTDGKPYDQFIINETSHNVTILPDIDYRFEVTANLTFQSGSVLLPTEVLTIHSNNVYSQWNSTCPLYIDPPIHQVSDEVVFYVLAAVIFLGLASIILSIVTVIFTKYHRLPLTVPMPNIPVSSNSYKSSPDMGDSSLERELLDLQDEWEINPRNVKFINELDHGAFGRVMTGLFSGGKVAIKIAKDDVSHLYREDLIHEITLMKQLGTHPNIVLLIGACTQREPLALILEYMPYGNLQSFLCKCRTEGTIVGANRHDVDEKSVVYAVLDEDGEVEQWTIAPTDLLSFARQIAKAMEYLVQRQYVHRDLAARNVLLGYNKVVKLGDFGLARAVSKPGEAYHKITQGKLPLKWMALESLRDRIFTVASDVWSFGIFLWELVTMGATPYPGISFSDFYALLASGYRMEKPSNCSVKLYELMFRCWLEKPVNRPSFTTIRESLEEMLSMDANYLDLDTFEASDIIDSGSTSVFSTSCENLTDRNDNFHRADVVLHVSDTFS